MEFWPLGWYRCSQETKVYNPTPHLYFNKKPNASSVHTIPQNLSSVEIFLFMDSLAIVGLHSNVISGLKQKSYIPLPFHPFCRQKLGQGVVVVVVVEAVFISQNKRSLRRRSSETKKTPWRRLGRTETEEISIVYMKMVFAHLPLDTLFCFL